MNLLQDGHRTPMAHYPSYCIRFLPHVLIYCYLFRTKGEHNNTQFMIIRPFVQELMPEQTFSGERLQHVVTHSIKKVALKLF